MRRTSWRKTADLSERMEWQYLDEPAVLTWTVKAIDRSILGAGMPMLVPMVVVLLISAYNFLWGSKGLAVVMLIVALLCSFLLYKISMEKTVFVYRATKERLEICQWQDIPDLLFFFLRVFPFIAVGALLMVYISNPALSIAALAGPALVGIVLASVGSDSNYKTIYKKFRQHEFKWDDVERGLLDSKKGLIGLTIASPNNFILDKDIDFDNLDHHRYLNLIYFYKEQEADVLTLFRNMPSTDLSIVNRSFKYPFS